MPEVANVPDKTGEIFNKALLRQLRAIRPGDVYFSNDIEEDLGTSKLFYGPHPMLIIRYNSRNYDVTVLPLTSIPSVRNNLRVLDTKNRRTTTGFSEINCGRPISFSAVVDNKFILGTKMYSLEQDTFDKVRKTMVDYLLGNISESDLMIGEASLLEYDQRVLQNVQKQCVDIVNERLQNTQSTDMSGVMDKLSTIVDYLSQLNTTVSDIHTNAAPSISRIEPNKYFGKKIVREIPEGETIDIHKYIKSFVNDRCIYEEGSTVSIRDFKRIYKTFADENNFKPVNMSYLISEFSKTCSEFTVLNSSGIITNIRFNHIEEVIENKSSIDLNNESIINDLKQFTRFNYIPKKYYPNIVDIVNKSSVKEVAEKLNKPIPTIYGWYKKSIELSS